MRVLHSSSDATRLASLFYLQIMAIQADSLVPRGVSRDISVHLLARSERKAQISFLGALAPYNTTEGYLEQR
jgi:hypothetical protein